MPQDGTGPPSRVTEADLRYSTDARKGVATAYLTITAASNVVIVKITYGDGVVENTIAESEVVFNPNNTAWKVEEGPNN